MVHQVPTMLTGVNLYQNQGNICADRAANCFEEFNSLTD